MYALIDTPINTFVLASRDLAAAKQPRVSASFFLNAAHTPPLESLGDEVKTADVPLFQLAAQQLKEYFDGARARFELPLDAEGTEFQHNVWGILSSIPFGDTVSYGQIATKLGNPGMARKVGQAVARNPLHILVPCHRVLGAGHRLAGYAGGLEAKRALLDLEQIAYKEN